MNRHVYVFLTILVSGQFSLCLAAEQTLDSLKQTYEAEVQRIRDTHEESLKGLLDAYGKSLDTAIDILKREGDPDKILQAHSEKRRFEEERTVPKDANAKLPAVLKEVQSGYNDALKRANVEKGEGFVDLTKRYSEALDRLMRSLAAQDKLDLSLNVKAEKKRVEFVLADVKSKVEAVRRARLPAEAKDAVEWNGHLYKRFLERLSWKDAKARCEAMGGYLACVTSDKENQFVGDLADGKSMWLGGSDHEKEGTWRWVSGEPFRYTKWYPDQPRRGHPTQHYLHIGVWWGNQPDNQYLWNDNDSVPPNQYKNHGFICEWDF